MSGRRKGADAQREAARVLRAAGLRVVLALRDSGACGPDVDAFVRLATGRWHALQIKRQEDPRPGAWTRDYVHSGASVMYRRNRERWTVLARVPVPYPQPMNVEPLDVETFAALVLGGDLL